MRGISWKRTVVVAAAVAAAVVLTGQFALGAPTRLITAAAPRTTVVRGPDATTTTSTGWVDLPGAIAPDSVPASPSSTGSTLFLATYTAESACSGGTGYCRVRILVGGQEAEPAVGGDFAFDSSNGGQETSASWESHAMQRSFCIANDGAPHDATTRVQYSTTDPATTLRLDDWHLTVQAIPTGTVNCASA
jgi:hypothetical protein